jgi:hypothetical protein
MLSVSCTVRPAAAACRATAATMTAAAPSAPPEAGALPLAAQWIRSVIAARTLCAYTSPLAGAPPSVSSIRAW